MDSGSISSRLLALAANQTVQATRISTGSILAGLRAKVTVTWPQSFVDSNYTVVAFMSDTSAIGLGLLAERVQNVTATTCDIQVFNASIGSLGGTLHVIGVHD